MVASHFHRRVILWRRLTAGSPFRRAIPSGRGCRATGSPGLRSRPSCEGLGFRCACLPSSVWWGPFYLWSSHSVLPALFGGSRVVTMSLLKDTPPSGLVAGFEVRVWYRRQPRLCPIWGAPGHRPRQCPLNGLCRRCRRAGRVGVAWTPKIPLTMKTEKRKLTITPKLTITEYTYPFPQSRNTPP